MKFMKKIPEIFYSGPGVSYNCKTDIEIECDGGSGVASPGGKSAIPRACVIIVIIN